MKRLPVMTSISRHQRGFIRATAVLFSAALVSAGIVTTQQVKAHQYSHAKHVLAIKKLAIKDCGCGVLIAASHSSRLNHGSKLYQASIVTTTDNYDHAVALKAGQRLALGVSDPTGAIQPGGSWTTNFGSVDASGVYTAPSFTPPEGMDQVHYVDPNGSDVFINVRILPNLSIPNSGQTPSVTVAYTTGGAVQAPPALSAQTQQAPAGDIMPPSGGVSLSDQLFVPTSQTIVEAPGDTPAPPLQLNTTTPLVGETVSGISVLTLPATDGGSNATSAIYAQPVDEAPQLVTLLPNVPNLVVRCDSGEKAEWGPYSITVTPHKNMETLASIKADSGVTATVLSNFGIHLTLNFTYNVKGQYYDWKQTRTKYVYACVNRRWVLQYTRHCDAYSLSLITTPPWAILFEGFPRNNAPRPFGYEACHV